MEAWRKELYANSLFHHGIKGQQWGKKNGPPYPLDEEDHSANEKKMNWKQSISDFVDKYGSHRSNEESEYKDDLDTKYEQASWYGKVDSRLNKVASNFNVSKDDLINDYVKNSDTDKFLNLLSKSGVISAEDKERLSKSENKAELDSMRQAIVGQYDEKERRAQEKAASKGGGRSGGSGGRGGSGKGSGKTAGKEKKESENKDASAPWEKPLYNHLTSLMKSRNWSYGELIKNVINSHGDSYDEFLVALGESNAISKQELNELKKNPAKLNEMRSKALKYFRQLRDSTITDKDLSDVRKNKSGSGNAERKNGFIIVHSGVSILNGAPGRGSGRRPLGSGKDPYQDYPGMLKKKSFKDKIREARESSVYYKAKNMSNQDLNDAVSRLKAEQAYISMSTSKITDGRAFVEGLAVKFGTRTVNKFVEDMADQTGLAASKKLFGALKDVRIYSGASKRAEKGAEKSDKNEPPKPESPKTDPPKPPKPNPPKSTPAEPDKDLKKEATNLANNKELQDRVDREHRKLFTDTIDSTPSQADVSKKVKTAVENEVKKTEVSAPKSSTNTALQNTVNNFGKEAKRLEREAKRIREEADKDEKDKKK